MTLLHIGLLAVLFVLSAGMVLTDAHAQVADTTAPVTVAIVAIDANTIVLTASETLAGSSVATDFRVFRDFDGNIYTVAGNPVISENTVTITFSDDIASNRSAEVTYVGSTITDVTGNFLPEFSFRFLTNAIGLDPRIGGVYATGGPYKAGDTFDIIIVFSESVTVTGFPQLTLETGTNDAVVNYFSGSPGTSIAFRYTVAAGHNSGDLDYVSNSALALNGGTITATDGGANADTRLTTPTALDSISSNSDVIVDALAPTFSSAATTNENTIVITASEPLDGTVVLNDFTLTGNTFSTPPIISDNIITITVDRAITFADELTVSYTAGDLTDVAGNALASFGPEDVTNNMPVPVATFADTIGSTGPDDGKFNSPYGITTNSTHILVADSGNDRIQIFDLDGNHLSSFGSNGRDPGKFDDPRGITTNSTHILVADTGNSRIQIFDLDGTHVSQFGSNGTGNDQFYSPSGITTNSTHILVADTGNHRIQIFDLDGNYVSKFGIDGPGNGQFRFPTGITTNSTHILVADSGNSRVQIFDLVGSFVGKFGSDGTDNGQFSSTSGIAVTPIRILVTDLNSGRVQIFDLDGSFVGKFGSQGQDNGQFFGPRGITTNSTHILVADSGNNRIQVFDFAPTAVITTINSIGGIHNSGTVSYIVTFSEDVTGFDCE